MMTVYLSGPGGGLEIGAGSKPALSGAEVPRMNAELKKAEMIKRRFTTRLDIKLP
jgi:hypothetical protein